MRLLGSILLLSSVALVAHGYTCPSGRSKKVIRLGMDQSEVLETQEGDKYGRKVNCRVIFKKKNKKLKCKLQFSCEDFALIAKKPTCRGGSDFFVINRKKFCGTNAPEVETPKVNLAVVFKTNKRSKGDTGAICTATCASGAATTAAPTTTAPTTGAPTTAAPTTTGSGVTGGSGSSGYTQAWLRGPGDKVAHVHEGIELADASGFVAVGETSGETNFGAICVTRVNSEGAKVWTKTIGTQKGTGHAVIEQGSNLIVGGGIFKDGRMQATLQALDTATGSISWSTVVDHTGFGAIRGLVVDGDSLVATGYIGNNEPGFLFIADGDNARAIAWKFDLQGTLVATQLLGVGGMSQGAKIRVDKTHGGYVVVGSRWNDNDDQQCVLVKLDSNLSVEWNKDYGLSSGMDQCFDMVVDSSGDYYLGGHTTAGVTNWDFLGLKIDGNTRQQLWRNTYGQPRGFDARYIHDELWGVALDPQENFLMLGGSGDEYSYSATLNGWSSDVWVSYLIVVKPDGTKDFEGIFGDKRGNEAGEYLAVTSTGDIMIFTDSDTTPGFGFLKITKNT